MSSYFVAQINVHNYQEYEKYLESFDDIFSRYKGEYLAIDESPTLLEGEWQNPSTSTSTLTSDQFININK
jgi:uncharacterized protein (DUF1330 family)